MQVLNKVSMGLVILAATMLAMLAPRQAWAIWPVQPELDRPMISALPAKGLELWGQYDSFSPNMDVLHYASRLGTSTRLQRFDNVRIGIKYAPTSRLSLAYRYLISNQNVSRVLQPTSIDDQITGHDARLQYTFYRTDKLELAVEGGMRTHQAKRLDFYRYDGTTGGISFSAVSLPGQPPLFSLVASDRSWVGALRGAVSLAPHLRVDAGVEMRQTTVSAKLLSVNLSDRLIGPALRNESPQDTPWHELQLMFQLGTTWAPYRWLGLSAHYTFYDIHRSGYIPKSGTIDYNTNHQLDGYVFIHLNPYVSIFGHGRISRRFILGEMPLAYNTRVSSHFKNPFGYLSAGISCRF